MRAAALVVLAGCAGGMHGPASRDDLAQRIASSDAAQLAAMLRPGLFYGGLWFDDPACQQQFVAPGVIGKDRVTAFASCLAGLHLQPGARKHPYGDVLELEYAPGFEVEAQFDDAATVVWIGYAGRHDLRDALPSITPVALEALRTAGTAIPALDASAEARLQAERAELRTSSSYVWLKMCLDTEGRVTGAKPREESSLVAGDVFEAAVLRWQFHPFAVAGRAIPVCALLYISDRPDEKRASALPQPVPEELGSVVVAHAALHRVSGRTQLIPPEPDRIAMTQLGVHHVIGTFAYCIDEHGAVSKVAKVRSTGFAGYDAVLEDALRGWRYEPFVVEGKAGPACAGAMFIYRQR